VTLIATAVQIAAAIGTANGTTDDPIALQINIQTVRFNADGNIIVYTRNSAGTDAQGDQGTLLAIEPTAPYTIHVLATAKNGGNTPVPGGMGMVMNGNTAYILNDNYYFPNLAEGIYAISTSPVVDDGSKTTTLIVDSAALQAASGDSSSALALSDGVMLDANTMILINSGVTASNDNLVKVDLSGTPTASLYVAATDIEADLGTTDVGFTAITADPSGKVYLHNYYGNSTFDDGVVILSNIVPPNADAAIELETKIATDLGGTDFNSGGWDSLAYSSVRGGVLMLSGGTGCKGVVRCAPVSAVSDWTLY